jgi:hypothetical protein
MGAPRVKSKVLEYLAKHPNANVWRGDIARDLGLTDAQVTASIGSTFRSESEAKAHIVVVEQGSCWRWSDTPLVQVMPTTEVELPAKPKSARIFVELVGLPDGRLLIQESEGGVWFATAVGK